MCAPACCHGDREMFGFGPETLFSSFLDHICLADWLAQTQDVVNEMKKHLRGPHGVFPVASRKKRGPTFCFIVRFFWGGANYSYNT